MAQYNHRMNPNVQTVFLPCDEGAREISSTAVRKRLDIDDDISDVVARGVTEYLKEIVIK